VDFPMFEFNAGEQRLDALPIFMEATNYWRGLIARYGIARLPDWLDG